MHLQLRFPPSVRRIFVQWRFGNAQLRRAVFSIVCLGLFLVALVYFDYRSAKASTWSAASHDHPGTVVSPPDLTDLGLQTVAFVTYELYPVTSWGGGAGVVINGLILDLLHKGHEVIVLADFEYHALAMWESHVLQMGPFVGGLHVRHLNTVLRGHPIRQSASIFMTKSRMFARALSIIHQETPFNVVECFDYAGVSFELLRPKVRGVVDYLPEGVAVAVRTHGLLNFIDKAEGNEVALSPPSERNIMYLMEEFGLLASDIVLCQTEPMRDRLVQDYSLDPADIQLAPAPLESIMTYVDKAMENVGHVSETWMDTRTFLIYGRLQLVKGLETIVRAGVQLLTELGQDGSADIKFIFAGPDTHSDEHGMMVSRLLISMIPNHLRHHFDIRPVPIDRSELARLSRESFAAIFASQFESLNLAVHEVSRMKVPVILSRIPPFEKYFANTPISTFFDAGNAQSLKDALSLLLYTKEGRRIVKTARNGNAKLNYDDATKIYRSYTTPQPPRRLSKRARELANTIMDGEFELN